MLVYQGIKSSFIEEVNLGIIADKIREKYIELLKKSEAKFRDFAEFLPQTVFETDLFGNFSFVNKNGFTMFGYSEDEVAQNLNILNVG